MLSGLSASLHFDVCLLLCQFMVVWYFRKLPNDITLKLLAVSPMQCEAANFEGVRKPFSLATDLRPTPQRGKS
jgi:hypothetical protein